MGADDCDSAGAASNATKAPAMILPLFIDKEAADKRSAGQAAMRVPIKR